MKLNKKGMEGEGMQFSMDKIIMLIIFLAVIAILVILYFFMGGVSSKSFSETVADFGKRILGLRSGD